MLERMNDGLADSALIGFASKINIMVSASADLRLSDLSLFGHVNCLNPVNQASRYPILD